MQHEMQHQIKKVLKTKDFFTAAGRTRTGTVLPA